MPKNDKDIELEERNKKNLNLEQERLAKEEEDKLLAQQQINENSKKPMPEEEKETFESQGVNYNLKPVGVWKDIIDDYEKEDYAKPRDEHGALVFPGPEEAKKFFSEQAGKNREFLTTLMEDGKLTDFHHFSCGNGQLYSGSFESIKSQLTQALETASEPNKAKIEAGLEKISAHMKLQSSPSICKPIDES